MSKVMVTPELSMGSKADEITCLKKKKKMLGILYLRKHTNYTSHLVLAFSADLTLYPIYIYSSSVMLYSGQGHNKFIMKQILETLVQARKLFQKHSFIYSLTSTGNPRNCMFLGGERKPEDPKETHMDSNPSSGSNQVLGAVILCSCCQVHRYENNRMKNQS